MQSYRFNYASRCNFLRRMCTSVLKKNTRPHMEYTVHHVLIDSAHRDASQPNWEYTALLGNEGALKNVVSISLLSCVIPQADSNVRADACQIYIREYYHDEDIWRYVTASVAPGYYSTHENYRTAIRAALARAERAPPLSSANDRPEYDLIYYENSHVALRMNDRSPTTNPQPTMMATSKSGVRVSFALVFDVDRRAPLYRLGFDARHELHTTDTTDITTTRALFVSNRLIDISTTDYVDIDIPELPDAALKMTTHSRRVFARIPTARNASRTIYDLNDRNVIRRHFFPMRLEQVTVRIYDQYGFPFKNNDADHTLDLEIVTVNHTLPPQLRWHDARPRGEEEEEEVITSDAPPNASSPSPQCNAPPTSAPSLALRDAIQMAAMGSTVTITVAALAFGWYRYRDVARRRALDRRHSLT